MRLFFLVFPLFLLFQPVLADDQVLTVLKELTGQIKELKGQVEKANHRIDELESQLQQARNEQAAGGSPARVNQQKTPAIDPAPAAVAKTEVKSHEKPVVTAGDVKGTFKIPGTETSIGIGGFVKTDVLLNSVSAGSDRLGDQQLLLSQIPVNGAPGGHNQTTFHSKESRLWFKSFTPSQWGDINTLIETDFFGDPATYTYTPRLRHAYGSIGHLLAGQTWSTFINAAAIPDHLDIGGSAGAINNFRQPLVRWSQPFTLNGLPLEWQAAIEAPRSRIWDAGSIAANAANPNTDSYFTTLNTSRYPDLLARFNFNPDWGNLSLAALGRQVRFANTTGLQRETWGGGVSVAGKISTFGLDNIRFMAHYGEGDGRYVATSNTFSDASLDNRGNFKLTTAYGGMLSYQHWWDKQWRSTVTYGFSQADQPGFVNAILNRQVQSLHANLLWSPVSQAMLGLEYTYADRELINGLNGDLQRLQFSARYSF